jgi:hypothetical protein
MQVQPQIPGRRHRGRCFPTKLLWLCRIPTLYQKPFGFVERDVSTRRAGKNRCGATFINRVKEIAYIFQPETLVVFVLKKSTSFIT